MCVHAPIGETDRSEPILHAVANCRLFERGWHYDKRNGQEALSKWKDIEGQKEGREADMARSWLIDNRPTQEAKFGLMDDACTPLSFRADCQFNPTQNA